ncbi:MAG: hypothetical protein ACI89X_001048 [Planctomycetota bacterium]|jgi:uncharacterized protein (TIGR02246 family)
MRAMKGWVLLAVLVTSGCAVRPAIEERALQDLWSEFERAFNAGDAPAAAKLYAKDSDRIGSNGVKVSGREEIEKKYAAMLGRRAADPSSKPFHATIEVRLLRPDVALLDGSWSGMRAGKSVRGLFTLTATKQRGRWLIAAGRDRGIVVE